MGLFSKKSETKYIDFINDNTFENKVIEKQLSLRKEIVSEEVKKQKLSVSVSRVVFALEHSETIKSMYISGEVQRILERIMPVAMCLDDNDEMEFYIFDEKCRKMPSVNMKNINDYVNKVLVKSEIEYGKTCYAPAISKIFHDEKKYRKIPTFVIFITNGGNIDKEDTEKLIRKASKYNIFWKFVGIGSQDFSFLQKLDDLEGRAVNNADFISVGNMNMISDIELYSKLLVEYRQWLELCTENGIKAG